MSKADLFERIEGEQPRLVEHAQALWERPELGLHETFAARRQQEILRDAGFTVRADIADMPTAFVAAYGDGSPTIGILGEYDALPGLSQEAKADRSPIEVGAPGHGCGHNLFGTAGVGAALALQWAIDTGLLTGTVKYFGCPAEETLVGKTYMARAGAFDDLDAALTWHPASYSTPRLAASNALNSLQFTFEGTPAHAGGSPASGRSALDAVQLLNTGVEYMREHVSDDARLHYSITDGGDAPNVVPSEATVWYYVRAPDRGEVERYTDWVRDIARGAALMTQTDVSERFLTGCYDYRANRVISNVIWENMLDVGEIPYDEADRKFAADLQETLSEEEIAAATAHIPASHREDIRSSPLYSTPIEPFDRDRQEHGSTEVGDVSWIVPTGQFRLAAWPVGVPGHSWQVVAANGDFGQRAIVPAAQILAGTAFDLMTDPDRLADATTEFEEEIGSDAYDSPLPPDAEPPADVTSMDSQ